jgi:predicted DNA-binding antitoxin AbrB/MazE fold protein
MGIADKTTISALYKDGVLRPLEPLDLPEGARVEVTIDPQGLVRRLDDLLRDIHEHNQNIPLEQVEADVDRVIRELRGEAPVYRP